MVVVGHGFDVSGELGGHGPEDVAVEDGVSDLHERVGRYCTADDLEKQHKGRQLRYLKPFHPDAELEEGNYQRGLPLDLDTFDDAAVAGRESHCCRQLQQQVGADTELLGRPGLAVAFAAVVVEELAAPGATLPHHRVAVEEELPEPVG